jgi:hypothetical protein
MQHSHSNSSLLSLKADINPLSLDPMRNYWSFSTHLKTRVHCVDRVVNGGRVLFIHCTALNDAFLFMWDDPKELIQILLGR